MIAAGVALIGVLVMVADGLGDGRFLGQALSLFMTAGFAGLVVLQRRDPGLPVAPINALAALVAAAFGFAVAGSLRMTAFDLVDLFFFGVSTITVAFALFMEGAKTVPPAEASLIAMLDVVMGPLWVWIAFRERPSAATFVGGLFVLAAAAWRIAPELRRRGDVSRRPRRHCNCGTGGDRMDKFALVTGGGVGIGKASALKLAAAGWNVAVTGRRLEPLEATAREIEKLGRRALAKTCDIGDRRPGAGAVRRDRGGVRPARPAVQQRRRLRAGRADGGTDLRAVEGGGRRQSDRRVPLRAGRDSADEEADARRAAASSTTARSRRTTPRPNSAPYTATKHAITGLTKSIALDGRPFDIACGQIDIGNALTEMALQDDAGRAAGRRPHRGRADDGRRRGRRRRRSHGEPAAVDQHPHHDDHGDEDAVRRAGVNDADGPAFPTRSLARRRR